MFSFDTVTENMVINDMSALLATQKEKNKLAWALVTQYSRYPVNCNGCAGVFLSLFSSTLLPCVHFVENYLWIQFSLVRTHRNIVDPT